MTTWTDRALVAIPTALIDAANWLAAVVDPDTGGAQTFTADRTMTIGGVEHVYSAMPFTSLLRPIVMARNPAEWALVIPTMAATRGRETLALETIEALRQSIKLNDECLPDSEQVPSPVEDLGHPVGESVVLQDGRVFLVPRDSRTARVYDPKEDTLSVVSGAFEGAGAFSRGVRLASGRVFLVPLYGTTARIYDPETDTLSTPVGTFPGGRAFGQAVPLSDGRLFFVPRTSTTARVYDPEANTLLTPAGSYPGDHAFISGVRLLDGRVFCVPFNSPTARIYDPETDTLWMPSGTYPGNGAFYAGRLMNGQVLCLPFNSTTARLYDPETDTLSIPVEPDLGGALLDDGAVLRVPRDAASVRLVSEAKPDRSALSALLDVA